MDSFNDEENKQMLAASKARSERRVRGETGATGNIGDEGFKHVMSEAFSPDKQTSTPRRQRRPRLVDQGTIRAEVEATVLRNIRQGSNTHEQLVAAVREVDGNMLNVIEQMHKRGVIRRIVKNEGGYPVLRYHEVDAIPF